MSKWVLEYYTTLEEKESDHRWIQLNFGLTLEEALQSVDGWKEADASLGIRFAYRISDGNKTIIL